MKKRRIIAAALSAVMLLSLAACGSSETGTTTTAVTTTADPRLADITDAVNTGASDEDINAADEEDMTLVWMSHYDLNPGPGKERSAELALFEDEYGGKIVYKSTTWDARFDDLATSIISDQAPDIFPYEWLAFPSGVMKGQYQPIDELVDWESPLWCDMKPAADKYVYNGKHYVAPLYVIESLLLIYDKTAIEEDGLEDPYELYQNGEWDWNAWQRIMEGYVDAGEGRIGCTNAFGRSIIMSTGETFITYDGEKFSNNMNNANIQRAQEFLGNLAKQGLTGNGEYLNAGSAFLNGNILFYGSGRWDIKQSIRALAKADHEAFVVPMPKDPQSDKLYVAENLQATMWVTGSTKVQAMKAYLEANRRVQTEEEYIQLSKETTLKNEMWTEEIYDAVQDICSSKFEKVFDYGYGMSDEMSTLTETLYNCCCFDNDQNTGWANMREANSGLIDSHVETVNARW